MELIMFSLYGMWCMEHVMSLTLLSAIPFSAIHLTGFHLSRSPLLIPPLPPPPFLGPLPKYGRDATASAVVIQLLPSTWIYRTLLP
jgi:hypothetical protein